MNKENGTIDSLAELHRAIIEVLVCKLKHIATVDAYPRLQRRIALPLVLIELSELEPGDDPHTGVTAFVGRFQARAIVDPNLELAELVVRELAANVAIAITHENWGLPINMAKLSRISEAISKPDLEGYLIWSVEWTHEFHLGVPIWPYPDETGQKLLTGIAPGDSPLAESDYVPVEDE